jgi:O-acetylserine/cysteine efflux transporter
VNGTEAGTPAPADDTTPAHVADADPPAATAPKPVGPVDLALLVLVTALWGGNFAVVKLGLVELPPLTFVLARFALIALCLAPFLRWPHGKGRQLFGLSVTLGVLHFGIMFSAMQHIDAATAAIAVQLQVPFAALLAWIFFRDRFGWRRTLGTLVAFAGVVVIAGEPRFEGGLVPLLLVILAACIWAFTNIQVKWLGPALNVFQITGWAAIFSVPQLLALAWLVEGNPLPAYLAAGWIGWSAIIYQAIGVTVLGYGFWYGMMRRHAVNQVMPLTLLVPIFGVLSGVIFLDEALTLPTVIGGLATILGVAIIVIRRPRLLSARAGRI